MAVKFLPTLYKKSSTGKLLVWKIGTDDNTIITRHGQDNGAIQEDSEEIKEGKNIGRANETTPVEQAASEAQSRWEKKLKGAYVRTAEAAMNGEASELVEGGILPMLAKKYSEDADKIVWPAYCQPKFDGHRCLAPADDAGHHTLWSRTRKPINSMVHIAQALEAVKFREPPDGELYHHDYRDKFEQLTHYIRQASPQPGCEIVQYHIYDIALPSMPFSERLALLRAVLPKPFGPLIPVETIEVADEDELMVAFEHFLELGYEGAMVRNAAGLYVNKRSVDLQKVKKFDDSEFECVGVEEGRGKLAGHAILVCRTDKGVEFTSKMKGPTAQLKQYWEHPELVVGKQITVEYQGWCKSRNKATGKIELKPRFNRSLRIRQDA